MFPNPDAFPRLPVARTVLREHRYVDCELRAEAAEIYAKLGIRAGDVVELSEAPLEPEGMCFIVESAVRPLIRVGQPAGLIITVRPVGPSLEEARVCAKGLLTGSKYTILSGTRIGEFTVHRNITVEGIGALKLHFAHGSQMHKLQLTKGAAIKIKERPCGTEEWTVLQVHTENLERCPNCRTGLSGPRAKEFNAADLCAPGTQWALVCPTRVSPQGLALFSERLLPVPSPSSTLDQAFLRFVARPDPRR